MKKCLKESSSSGSEGVLERGSSNLTVWIRSVWYRGVGAARVMRCAAVLGEAEHSRSRAVGAITALERATSEQHAQQEACRAGRSSTSSSRSAGSMWYGVSQPIERLHRVVTAPEPVISVVYPRSSSRMETLRPRPEFACPWDEIQRRLAGLGPAGAPGVERSTRESSQTSPQ